MLDQNNNNDIPEIEISDEERLHELSRRRLSAKNKRRQQLKTRLLLLGGTAAAIIILITAVSLISAGSNNAHLQNVKSPGSLERLPGDCFYFAVPRYAALTSSLAASSLPGPCMRMEPVCMT